MNCRQAAFVFAFSPGDRLPARGYNWDTVISLWFAVRKGTVMTKVTLDDSLLAKLQSGDEPLELCAPSGETVGHFLPQKVYQRLLFDWANAKVTDEELQRRLQQPGGRTLADIWSRLENKQIMGGGCNPMLDSNRR